MACGDRPPTRRQASPPRLPAVANSLLPRRCSLADRRPPIDQSAARHSSPPAHCPPRRRRWWCTTGPLGQIPRPSARSGGLQLGVDLGHSSFSDAGAGAAHSRRPKWRLSGNRAGAARVAREALGMRSGIVGVWLRRRSGAERRDAARALAISSVAEGQLAARRPSACVGRPPVDRRPSSPRARSDASPHGGAQRIAPFAPEAEVCPGAASERPSRPQPTTRGTHLARSGAANAPQRRPERRPERRRSVGSHAPRAEDLAWCARMCLHCRRAAPTALPGASPEGRPGTGGGGNREKGGRSGLVGRIALDPGGARGSGICRRTSSGGRMGPPLACLSTGELLGRSNPTKWCLTSRQGNSGRDRGCGIQVHC